MDSTERISVMDVTVRASCYIHDSNQLVRDLALELKNHERLAISPSAIDPMSAALARIRAAIDFKQITHEVRTSIENHDVIGIHSNALFNRIHFLRKKKNTSNVVARLGAIQDLYCKMTSEIIGDDEVE